MDILLSGGMDGHYIYIYTNGIVFERVNDTESIYVDGKCMRNIFP
jgi:hypothetical protein